MIESLITRLVQQAPGLDETVVTELVGELRGIGSPLARSIAHVVELVGARRIDPGIALPALAMACTTLTDPRLTDREHEAARFEIETLLPVPAQPEPDVPLSQLTRGRRPQT